MASPFPCHLRLARRKRRKCQRRSLTKREVLWFGGVGRAQRSGVRYLATRMFPSFLRLPLFPLSPLPPLQLTFLCADLRASINTLPPRGFGCIQQCTLCTPTAPRVPPQPSENDQEEDGDYGEKENVATSCDKRSELPKQCIEGLLLARLVRRACNG